jgi:hypothetical protein
VTLFKSLFHKPIIEVDGEGEMDEGNVRNLMSILQTRQDCACLCTATCTHASLEQFKWEIVAHPEYSPNTVPTITRPST